MDKRKYKVIDPFEPIGHSHRVPLLIGLDVFCARKLQKNELVCPVGTSWGTETGYKTLADIFRDFDKIDGLLSNLKLSRLDDGHGVEETLLLNQAKWHDSCRLKYNKTQLQRAQKRTSQGTEEYHKGSSRKYTRQSTDQVPPAFAWYWRVTLP